MQTRRKQEKRWEDNVKEWTMMDFASSTRTAETRTRWRGTVAIICGAPKLLQSYEIE